MREEKQPLKHALNEGTAFMHTSDRMYICTHKTCRRLCLHQAEAAELSVINDGTKMEVWSVLHIRAASVKGHRFSEGSYRKSLSSLIKNFLIGIRTSLKGQEI